MPRILNRHLVPNLVAHPLVILSHSSVVWVTKDDKAVASVASRSLVRLSLDLDHQVFDLLRIELLSIVLDGGPAASLVLHGEALESGRIGLLILYVLLDAAFELASDELEVLNQFKAFHVVRDHRNFDDPLAFDGAKDVVEDSLDPHFSVLIVEVLRDSLDHNSVLGNLDIGELVHSVVQRVIRELGLVELIATLIHAIDSIHLTTYAVDTVKPLRPLWLVEELDHVLEDEVD